MANLVKLLDRSGQFTISLIDGTTLAQQVAAQHALSPVVTDVLTRLLMATALLRSAEKDANTRLTVALNSVGPIHKMVSYAAADALKCYCDYDAGVVADGGYDQLLAAGGDLTIVKEYGNGMRSTGRSAIINGDIATDLTHYYIHSEQQASTFFISRQNCAGKLCYGAVMLTLLPVTEANSALYELLDRRLTQFGDLAALLADGLTIEDAADKLLQGIESKLVAQDEIAYRCDCSRSKMTAALISLGAEQLQSLHDEDGQVEMNCHYCSQKYHFSAAELANLIRELIYDTV